jgi:hypothetical protein
MPVFIAPSINVIKSEIFKSINDKWKRHAQTTQSQSYVPVNIPSHHHRKRLYAKLNIRERSLLGQFRTGHTTLNQRRYNDPANSQRQCACGQEERIDHFLLHCANYADIRHELREKAYQVTKKRTLSLRLLLDNPFMVEGTIKFIQDALERRDALLSLPMVFLNTADD